jgi:hypothetical protein
VVGFDVLWVKMCWFSSVSGVQPTGIIKE